MAEHFRGNVSLMVQILAHEIGHAIYTPEKQILFTGLSKNDYVSQNTFINLRDEGAAVQKNIEIQREILANTTRKDSTGKVTKKGVDIGIGGAITSKTITSATGIKSIISVDNTLSFNQAYNQYEADKKYDEVWLHNKIGRLYANHVKVSGKKDQTYYQYYQSNYISHWDKYH